MDAVITIEGPIVGKRAGVYKEKPFGVVQMQARDRDAVTLYEINLAENFDITQYATGTVMKIPVRVSASKDGKKIYFRQIAEGDFKGGARQQAAETPRPTIKL